MVKENLNEDVQDTSYDANGAGSLVPGPVDTGDTHANRPQDNLQTDADIAVIQGQPVPRSVLLRALVSTLQGLDPIALDRIANEIDAMNDVNANPSGATDGLQGQNLASIQSLNAVQEDIKEIFAGESLTEEFKEKTALVFEAAVGARVAVITEEIREAQEIQVNEAVEAITEQLVDQLDKYISFAAENFVDENTPILEQTIRSVAAEKFMEGVLTLAEQFNIDMPQAKIDVVEALNTKIEDLEARLNESVDAALANHEELKSLKMEKVFEEVSVGLTGPQKDRLRTLSENVSITESVDTYKNGLVTLKESVAIPVKKEALIEDTTDGVVLLEGTQGATPIVESKNIRDITSILDRMS